MVEEKQKPLKKKSKYGWILIGLVGLFLVLDIFLWNYFGVLNPVGRPGLKATWIFDDVVDCKEIQIISDDGTGHGVLKFRLENKLRQKSSFEFKATEGFRLDRINATCTINPNDGVDIESKTVMEITCIFNQTFFEGDKYKFEINGTYGPEGVIQGEIFGVIQSLSDVKWLKK